MTQYTITYSNGDRYSSTLEGCYAEIKRRYPDMVGVHEVGQVDWSEDDASIAQEDDGYRILVWENEESSIDDDGSHAIASVWWSK